MNGRQRLETAMRRGVPDRVPVWCQLSAGHVDAHGLPNGRPPRNGEEGIVAACNLTRRYRFDALFLGSVGLRPDKTPDGIECMDPPPLGDVELADAKRRIGSRIFLRGNLDSVNVLWRADEETFVRNVRATIEAGKPGGGYILGTACSVAPEAPPERMARLVDMAEKWGTYPEAASPGGA